MMPTAYEENERQVTAQVAAIEQEVSIAALSHLIEEDFDVQNSCHAVCLLLVQMYTNSDDKINRLVANLAAKALSSTVELERLN